MSTNFFWHHNICDCCGRYDELHICKSFHTFRGHFGDEWDEVNHEILRPPLIVSWKGWTEKLRSGGQIFDEYRRQHDIEEFIAATEALPRPGRRQHHDYCVEHYPPGVMGHREVGVGPDMEWLCEDGFSFYGGEFS